MVALTVAFWKEEAEDNMSFSGAPTECLDVIEVGGGDAFCKATTFTDDLLRPMGAVVLLLNPQIDRFRKPTAEAIQVDRKLQILAYHLKSRKSHRVIR